MGFGQYSAQGQQRRSKRDMVAAIDSPIVASRMIARNTLEYETADGSTLTRYHDTDVVKRAADGTITLDTGGWNTMTTRGRMSDAMPAGYSVYTHRGSLYLATPDGAHEFTERARFKPGGAVFTDILSGEAEAYDSVRKLVDGYVAKLRKDGIPEDAGGDPWVAPSADTGKYDKDTVLLWLGDNAAALRQGTEVDGPYVFQNFIWQAILWSGHNNMAADYWMREFNRPGAYQRKHICRTVRRYIRACLGYASS